MKVLVTGSSGFLGKYILSELIELGFKVHTLGRKKSSTIFADLVMDDFNIEQHYDCIIHVAGKAHSIPKTSLERKEFYDVNLKGTTNLLNALIKKPKYFIFISTVSVYGLDVGKDINEDMPLNSLEPYGQSKLMAEKSVLEWGEKHNVVITILRLPLLFGVNPPGNLNSMINAIGKGYYFNIDDGNVRKSMVFASDVASFLPKVATYGGIYNLTDGHHPSFKQLSVIIASHYNVRKPISLPYFFIFIIANCADILQKILKKKMPINKRQLLKMTNSLTFSDQKARKIGWNPKKIIDYPNNWL